MKTTAQNQPRRHRCYTSKSLLFRNVSSYMCGLAKVFGLCVDVDIVIFVNKSIIHFRIVARIECMFMLCIDSSCFSLFVCVYWLATNSDRIIEMIWQFFDGLSQEKLQNFNFHSYLTPNTYLMDDPSPWAQPLCVYSRAHNCCGYALFTSQHEN